MDGRDCSHCALCSRCSSWVQSSHKQKHVGTLEAKCDAPEALISHRFWSNACNCILMYLLPYVSCTRIRSSCGWNDCASCCSASGRTVQIRQSVITHISFIHPCSSCPLCTPDITSLSHSNTPDSALHRHTSRHSVAPDLSSIASTLSDTVSFVAGRLARRELGGAALIVEQPSYRLASSQVGPCHQCILIYILPGLSLVSWRLFTKQRHRVPSLSAQHVC